MKYLHWKLSELINPKSDLSCQTSYGYYHVVYLETERRWWVLTPRGPSEKRFHTREAAARHAQYIYSGRVEFVRYR